MLTTYDKLHFVPKLNDNPTWWQFGRFYVQYEAWWEDVGSEALEGKLKRDFVRYMDLFTDLYTRYCSHADTDYNAFGVPVTYVARHLDLRLIELAKGYGWCVRELLKFLD